MADERTIVPVTNLDTEQTQPRLTIAPSISPPDGSVWVFNGTGYTKIVEPWAVEGHLPPPDLTERFGSVEAWAAYARGFSNPLGSHLLTWSESGLRAVMDYLRDNGEPGRRTWLAVHAFERTVQWRRWTALADGRARGQQELLEALEDNAEDIVDPNAAQLARLLRTMRGTVSSTAESTLNEDGSYDLAWNKSSSVKVGDGSLTFPPEIRIAVPVFKGHVEAVETEGADGNPALRMALVRFGLKVRIRVNPDSAGHLQFRLSMPDRETALEQALANRVAAAEAALGDGYSLLRGAGN